MRYFHLVYLALIVLFFISFCSVEGTGQTTSSATLDDFAGKWKIDFEKSYSKSERRKVSNYNVEIFVSGDRIKLNWDYTIDSRRSHFSEEFVVDGKEQKTDFRMN